MKDNFFNMHIFFPHVMFKSAKLMCGGGGRLNTFLTDVLGIQVGAVTVRSIDKRFRPLLIIFIASGRNSGEQI